MPGLRKRIGALGAVASDARASKLVVVLEPVDLHEGDPLVREAATDVEPRQRLGQLRLQRLVGLYHGSSTSVRAPETQIKFSGPLGASGCRAWIRNVESYPRPNRCTIPWPSPRA